MIEIKKTKKKNFGKVITRYEVTGHTETAICNGFSFLICVFCEELSQKADWLKYDFERSDRRYVFEDGVSLLKELTGEEHSYVEYGGDVIETESFFDTGIRLLNEKYPDLVAITHST